MEMRKLENELEKKTSEDKQQKKYKNALTAHGERLLRTVGRTMCQGIWAERPVSVQDKTFNNWLNMAYQLVELQMDTVWFSINGSYPVYQYTSKELAVVRSKWTQSILEY